MCCQTEETGKAETAKRNPTDDRPWRVPEDAYDKPPVTKIAEAAVEKWGRKSKTNGKREKTKGRVTRAQKL